MTDKKEKETVISQISQLREALADADKVLVGIGGEMQVKLENLRSDPVFAEKWEDVKAAEWLIPYLIRHFLANGEHKEIKAAYQSLAALLQGKDYFVVSLSTDGLIGGAGLEETKVVCPCGDFSRLQCVQDCKAKLFRIPRETEEQVAKWVAGEISRDEIAAPVCPDCGQELVFNQYGQPKYNEKAYVELWQSYQKWLQSTVNKKLVVLELGCGMEFASVFRFPAEKVCYYNLKAKLFRVHHMLYQVDESMQDRAVSVHADAVTFLNAASEE